MATFGLFDSVHTKPLQQYEGDKMEHHGDYVYIFKKEGRDRGRQVAAISLDKGQSVKEITAQTARLH